MSSFGNLRRELFSLLSWHMHRTDRHPLETLERLVMKSAGVDIRGYQIGVSGREFMLRQLVRIRGDAPNEGDAPKREDAPLILFQGDNLYILDGQNRVNKWIKDQNKGPHRAIIVEVYEDSGDREGREVRQLADQG